MISKFLFGLLILFTLSTTVLAVTKVLNELNEPELDNNVTEINPTITNLPTQLPTHIPTVLPTVLPTAKLIPTKKVVPTVVVSSNNQCIIVVAGQQYNVTTLQSTHSGGNIFQCGTDMTNVYQRQHGNGLSLIQRYLVTNSTSGSNLPTAISQRGGRNRGGNDD